MKGRRRKTGPVPMDLCKAFSIQLYTRQNQKIMAAAKKKNISKIAVIRQLLEAAGF